ncbi:MAG TPA: lytic transglycosylase domain-containing protein [Solirubrobacteraceae bacterium]|nr:lytic transglycosylase domain-containing protein [Solirubrobacteraceae bacterium]
MNDRIVVAAATLARAGLLVKASIALALVLGALMLTLVVLAAWWAAAGGASAQTVCGVAEPVGQLAEGTAPAELVPLFTAAAAKYELGAEGPAILAGLTKVESNFGQNMGPSSAGAIGWTQFMPGTWKAYGVDADGDGKRDPFNAADAIHSAANYLRTSGAPRDWRKALFAYNHAGWYVEKVLRVARTMRLDAPAGVTGGLVGCAGAADAASLGSGVHRVTGGGEIVPIPGSPGEQIDSRILPDVLALQRRFKFTITDGYATSGHAAAGEHPLGLGLDVVPGPGGTWEDIDRLAAWAEPAPDKPRRPFRWVGYDGDENHGRGHHLHLSWDHAPASRPPAAWVLTLGAR